MPSSLERGTSDAAPRIVDVTGAAAGRGRAPSAPHRFAEAARVDARDRPLGDPFRRQPGIAASRFSISGARRPTYRIVAHRIRGKVAHPRLGIHPQCRGEVAVHLRPHLALVHATSRSKLAGLIELWHATGAMSAIRLTEELIGEARAGCARGHPDGR